MQRKIAKGSLKLLGVDIANAMSNRQRASAAAARFKPVWMIFVQNADGSFELVRAMSFRASSLTPVVNPRGIRALFPAASALMRRTLDSGVWYETRSEISYEDGAGEPVAETSTTAGEKPGTEEAAHGE